MSSRIATIIPPADLDYFFGVVGGDPVLTKQDKFAPVDGLSAHFENEADQQLLDIYDLYVKRKDKNVHKEFEEELKRNIRSTVREEHPYKKNVPVEVTVIVLMLKKRLKTVDIDNLLKSVLDCLVGIVIEDDAQIVNVFGKKREANNNGLLIGVRRLDTRVSWFKDVHLLTMIEDNKVIGRI